MVFVYMQTLILNTHKKKILNFKTFSTIYLIQAHLLLCNSLVKLTVSISRTLILKHWKNARFSFVIDIALLSCIYWNRFSNRFNSFHHPNSITQLLNWKRINTSTQILRNVPFTLHFLLLKLRLYWIYF